MDIAFEIVSFTRCRKGGMRQDVPIRAADAETAARVAARLATTRAAVWALARLEDGTELVAAFGDVPEPVLDIPRWQD